MSPESLASAGTSVSGINGFSPIGRLDTMSPSSLGGSLSAGGMHSQNLSISSTLVGTEVGSSESSNNGGLGRRQTVQPRNRRGNGHNPSHSRGHPEARTPGEYALHHLLNSFVAQADHKINQCISHVGEMVTPVEQLCGPGVDQTFDQLISALGHIARQKPKPLIDSLMFWRKAKGEAATAAKQQLNQQKSANPISNGLPIALPRRNTEPTQNDIGSSSLHVETDIAAVSLAGPQTEEAVLAERRATVSVYLVCRVLIEIFEQSSLSAITTDLAGRLEDIVFGQLKSVDPAQISGSSLRLANWRIYGKLLGHMSGVDFVSVTAKFVQELDACQKEIAKNPASTAARDAEGRAELLILAMRHLQIKTSSGSWTNSCNFVRAVASLFSIAHGQRIKQAYCQVLQSMLLSVAAEADVDLGAPKWKEALDIISTRLGQMLTKVRHWSNAFPLSITLLCVSPSDAFNSQWLAMIAGMATKLKDRSTRGLALQAICRLTWTYMNRILDALPSRVRKIEEVIKIALPQGKKTNLTTDAAVAEPLIQLIRIIGFRHQELCFRTIIFPLINSDLFTSGRDLRIEQMEPEKMVIGIRAFLAIMLDLEKGEQGCPPFPQNFPNSSVIEPMPASPTPNRLHLVAEAKSAAAAHNDTASRPVNTGGLGDVAKQYYLRFCEILGKITILCDNTFGGQATLNEKFGGPTPKTPLAEAFSFTRKEDGSIPDQKQAYYDLLHVAIQALPRCLSDHIPFTSLINLLCTGSAHIQSSIASSSAQSLRSIARQGHAQAVAIAFPRFIFSYDSKYSTMSDEGMLGSGHIETTLTLYIELLQIWVEELRQKTIGTTGEHRDGAGAAIARAMPLEMTHVYPHVDEIEAYGLFFLCSQSRKVRAFAVKVLRMVTEFDKAMGKDEHTRIIRILEDQSDKVLDLNDDNLSVAERSRLQMGKRKNATQNTLIEICSSEVSYDSTLWYKVFPNLIRIAFDTCPNAIALSRGIVCDRLLQMQNAIEYLAIAQDYRVAGRSASTSPDVLIDQWKLYLVMACVTLSGAGAQSQSQLANAAHTRKQSRNDVGPREKLSSARALFSAIIPLLSAGPDAIRNAIVLALGSIKHKLYRTLLESLQYAVTRCNDEAKARIGTHQRTPSNPQRNRQTERLRTEVTHVYKLTSTFLRDSEVCNDDWILNNLVNYAKDLRIFLSDAEIQNDWEFQRLRFHYCGLMEEVFEGINRSRNPSRWLPFESRKSAFTLMEDWCGYSSNQGQIAQREDVMKQSAFAQQQETGERLNLSAAMEIEKKNLRIAALSAMAALCAGPISIKTESKAILQFHLPRMLSWIESIFATVSDKMHAIGRRALKELIIHNIEHLVIMEHSVERCYRAERPKALESYFEVVSQVLIEHNDYPLAFWRILGAVLFTLGNENRDIRMKSAHLLRTLEERQQKSSKLQDFDISISDKTTAVYKLAQFEYSKRLSKAHSELAFVIFSEFSLHFKNVTTDHQRNMVAAILPWIQIIELQLDPNGGPTAVSYMLLSNLFEITIRSSNVLHNEVQALWQALATGPHGGNVQLILDFIITLSLERREQNFVDYAKQIVVYLSATPAGARVIEFFLLQLIPKNMVNEKKTVEQMPPDMKGLPYVADLAAILPTGHKQAGLSLGQIALIFLVDLMVAPVTLPTENAIKLIHATLILWDHYAATVQEQAREMLVHLIHELVTSKIGDDELYPKRKQIEKLVESIRGNEADVVWGYEDNNGKDDDDGASRVPQAMLYLTKEVVDLFSLVYEGMNDLWAKEALQWASTCPVRHLACRSFQVFRCISVTLDSRILADMLARLSNTIADEETDYQTFSMEILTTLKVIIGALSPADLLRYPQLFWTTCACLNTIHEKEFSETLGMLEKLLDRMDMADPAVIKTMMDNQPPKWEGGFEGLQPLVYKGLNSADSLDRTLLVLHRLAKLPNSPLVGDASRLLCGVLANLPRFLHQYDLESPTSCAKACALRLAEVASQQGCTPVARSLADFADGHYSLGRDFLVSIIAAIRTSFFPESDAKSLIFMMGLLTNKSSWFRLKTMEILCVLIPEVDMSKPDISCHGPDLISPLLRLLQTDLCPQALDVMDHIMEVSGNPMERHHMRMSLASGSARAIRKEYERTQSLYGIPLSSGWSIPIPAVYSSRTRNNVHAVFYTCGDAEVMNHQAAETPEVEFHADESYTDSYFPSTRTGTMKSVDTVTDTNMGDLVHKLDSLDDFFDEPDSVNDSMDGPENYVSAEMRDLGTNIYDQQTAPLLRKSLGRTSSSASFQNGLADSRPPTSHHYQQPSLAVMNPMAFTAAALPGPTLTTPSSAATVTGLPPTLDTGEAAPPRPSLHARSITSPANAYQVSQPTSMPLISILANSGGSFLSDEDDDYDDVIFSDSENTPFPALSITSTAESTTPQSGPGPGVLTSLSNHTTPTSATESNGPFSLEYMRKGMRRLTGGKSESQREKDRIREMARMRALSGGHSNAAGSGVSPKVPRVPLEYLNGIAAAGGTSPATSPGI
jgi:hypothetical protein